VPAKPFHVVPHAKDDHHWAVRREGASRASSLHATKEEAVRAAIVTAKRERAELEIHTQDGKIVERNSYDHDSRESRIREAMNGKPKTAQNLYRALVENGFIGAWKDRTDIGDSVEYIRAFRERASIRRRDKNKESPRGDS